MLAYPGIQYPGGGGSMAKKQVGNPEELQELLEGYDAPACLLPIKEHE